MQIVDATALSLECACEFESCAQLAFPLFTQLRDGYEHCSVLDAPESLAEWRRQHRTARKRADRARRLGYHFEEIKREEHEHAIFEINTSRPHRQGRRMSASYRTRPHFAPLPDYPCERHRVRTFGVLRRGVLVAYLWLYRVGELALVSSILGHGDHLANDVMFLLFEGVVAAEAEQGGAFVYNRHDSGTDGLRYFKSRLGFEARFVDWQA